VVRDGKSKGGVVGLNPADHIERACLCVKNVTSCDKAGWGSPTAPSFFSHSHLEMVFPVVLELLFLKVTAKSGFSTALLNANLLAPE
jgi:hypothetical protein